jgi:hypothetical protein
VMFSGRGSPAPDSQVNVGDVDATASSPLPIGVRPQAADTAPPRSSLRLTGGSDISHLPSRDVRDCRFERVAASGLTSDRTRSRSSYGRSWRRGSRNRRPRRTSRSSDVAVPPSYPRIQAQGPAPSVSSTLKAKPVVTRQPRRAASVDSSCTHRRPDAQRMGSSRGCTGSQPSCFRSSNLGAADSHPRMSYRQGTVNLGGDRMSRGLLVWAVAAAHVFHEVQRTDHPCRSRVVSSVEVQSADAAYRETKKAVG